jgi:DNA-binding Lrp family transcriptional regulator
VKKAELLILEELRSNSRKSLADLAWSADVPLSTVFKTVTRLQKTGVVVRSVSFIDFFLAGYSCVVPVFFNARDKEALKKFLLGREELNSLFRVSGDYDFYAELVFDSMLNFSRFFDVLRQKRFSNGLFLHMLECVKWEACEIPKEVVRNGRRA